jgi:hypothetical protein
VDDQLSDSFLECRFQVTSKAGVERIVDSLDGRVGNFHSLADEVKSTAEISQTDIASLSLLINLCSDLNVELQDHSFLLLGEDTASLANLGFLGVPLDDLPEVAFTLKLRYVKL